MKRIVERRKEEPFGRGEEEGEVALVGRQKIRLLLKRTRGGVRSIQPVHGTAELYYRIQHAGSK